MIGDAEGQSDDDDILQIVARDIDALPETVGSEQNRLPIIAKAIEQLSAWQALTLAIQLQIAFGKPARQLLRTMLQHPVARKQHERATSRLQNVVLDHAADRVFELPRRLIRVGNV